MDRVTQQGLRVEHRKMLQSGAVPRHPQAFRDDVAHVQDVRH